MSMAAAIDSRTAEAAPRAKPGHIAQVDIVTDFSSAERAWRKLEKSGQLLTAYQRFDFLQCWQNDVGARDDATPLIVIAYDVERRPLLLLPLTLKNIYGFGVASFMGGKHTTFNMALWDRDFAAMAQRADIETVLGELRQHRAVDVVGLSQQPLRWNDVVNPLALLSHQPSANDCPVLSMEVGATPQALISNSLRRRLKAKERKLKELPGYRHYVATDDADIMRLLSWFLRVKPMRMAQQRLPNVFAEAGVADFIHRACLARRPGGGRLIDIHALECDEEIIALYAGVADGQRFSMMFNSYTLSDHSRFSPGLLLIRNIIDHCAARGYRALDLGVGSDSYKQMFCKREEPIFDSFIALSARGRVAALAMSLSARAKYLVKHNRALLWVADGLRKAFRQHSAARRMA
ncbi:GNAT family N-acetyltransferase [Bradyrhizobium sp. Tv2a-2]|uniref:GNAT family N-acetyltransferase n=1 Tax=Bradyrhizobium sp. Tv2a-2 TaxID=113395 RepID=UPI0004641BA7|nr:GNAT family N-acetyltransferase [Bradyrhizobium sp. Tv2a-2]